MISLRGYGFLKALQGVTTLEEVMRETAAEYKQRIFSVDKELLIVGDRVLIQPEEGEDRTDSGLYLPQGVKEKDKVQSGRIIKTGPGYPIPDPAALEIEPWETPKFDNKYFPLQAKEGDFCIFMRNAGIEIEFEGKKYIVVPHSAILVVLR